MKLLTKFSLIFVAIFGVGLAAAGWISYSQLQANARDQIRDQARIMMDTALAMRRYTSDQIKPVLSDSAIADKIFHRQIVPAFSAIELFEYLHEKYPDYSYKEAALNPTNPRDRAVYWEEDIINSFRSHAELTNFEGERATPIGRSLYLARPIRAEQSCLECHSTPDAAPPGMIQAYGRANGFGWRLNDVVAAQIVSVPMTVPEAMARHEYRRLMASLAVVGVVTLALLDLVLVVTVTRPMGRLSSRADQISKGELNVPELEARGKDEISVLAAAFNRMHRSLVAAMKLLDKE